MSAQKRIVVKVGSNVLARTNGSLDITRVSAIVDQTIALKKAGYEVILVSSGAVACGRSVFRKTAKMDEVDRRQLYSAVGQVRLINLYFNLFREHGVNIGQVLTMKESFSTREQYLNQRNCMEVMLANGVVPIVNENDTISVTELMFTDNDELSGLVATMMDASTLVILSNIDGIFNGDPGSSGSSVIREIRPGEDISSFIRTGRSDFGRGGMLTKYSIAKKVAEEGTRVIIANGTKDNILVRLLEEPEDTECTVFVPSGKEFSSVKRWIAHSEGFAKGSVHINSNAATALRSKDATSLLLVGVTSVEGDFEDGDLVDIIDESGNQIGIGRSGYCAPEARRHIGEHNMRPLVHYDYLYLI